MAFVKDLTSSVMTGVTSLGSKAFDAFGINQATLSGAIDIVVIKHPPNSRPRCLDEDYKSHITSHVKFPLEDFNDDIDSTKPYYMSSPFHVRFGKLQLLRSNEVNVSITINDKHIDNLQMKLGIEGEAYFVVPTNKPLKHKKLLTSPLIKPHTSIKNITPFKISPINIQPLQPINSGPINDTKIKQKIKQINLSQIMSGKSSKNDDMPPLMLNIGSPNSADSGDVSHDISIKINSIPDEKDSKDDSEHLSTNSMHLDSVSVSIDKPINTVMKSMNSNENIHISPTLSATSSMLEDREVLSKDLMMDSATNTDNESVCTGGTGTDNESNIESDVGFDNFSGTHVMIEHIKMSLCASKLIIDSEKENKKMFQQYQITYNQFCSDPSILFDKNLIIQYKQRLYPAKIAMPMLFSLLSFGRPLTDKAIKKLNKKEEKEEKQNKIEDASEDVEGTNDYAWYWSWFKKKRKKKKRKKKNFKKNGREEDDEFDITSKGVLLSDGTMGYFRKTLRPTSEMLSKLPLKSGCNNITFTVSSTLQGTQSVSACIFLWDNTTKIVISDVDGTITKSDVMGHVAPLIVGSQWSHNGVAQLFTNIQNNGYRMLYLTSRGIGQSSVTRSYLFENVKQRNFSLPFGPIIMSPDSLTTAFYREVIVKKPHEFKIPALSNIQSLFNKTHNPFYAGFGNRSSDLYSYLEVGVPKNRIFIIKPSGKINTNNKLFKTTYDTLNIDIDQMFMNRKNKKSNELEEFNSHNYWNNNYYENVQLTDIDESNDSDNEIKEKPINNKNKKNNEKKETTITILNENINIRST